MLRIAIIIITLLSPAQAANSWQWQTQTSYHKGSDGPVFPAPETSQQHTALVGNLQSGGWQSRLAGEWQSGSGSDFTLSELFWQGEFQQLDWLIGKRRSDFGVSYGYRPLDLFAAYRRNPQGIQIEEGVGIISASQFSDAGELNLFYADSVVSEQGAAAPQRGLGLKWYQLAQVSEWQLLGYWDNHNGWNLGGSFVRTSGDSLEIHMEGRYQRHHQRYTLNSEIGAANFIAPVTHQQHRHGVSLLLGVNWSHAAGHTLIAEYWLDNRTHSISSWQRQLATTSWLQQHAANSRLNRASGLLFSNENLMRHNLLLHWHGTNGDWLPSVDLLIAPEDQGVIMTGKLSLTITQGWQLRGSWRYLGGAADAVYRQLPERQILLINLEGQF